MTKKTLILAEIRDGQLRNVTLEAVSAAKKVLEDGEIVVAVFGKSVEQYTPILEEYGVHKVYGVADEKLEEYTSDAYFRAFIQVIKATEPDVIFLGHTALGKDLAPRVAARMGLGLISDVTDVAVEDNQIVFTRPIFSGKAFQKKAIVEGTVFATIRPNNFELPKPEGNSTEFIPFSVELNEPSMTIKEIVRKTSGGIDLSEAKVVIAGGRGVKSADGFQVLNELAGVLGGAVGATRGACDADYCDYSMQIGQTGKIVTPDLYIACGISGAIQHVAGMSNSKVIIAINKDSEAPIFSVADYGIVGDLFEVVPKLTEAFKNTLSVTAE
ncbi:electron transfer flavoprotein subunit alpha/FixB family protein [Niallia sp. 03091]|uniref:electron transfer flavoprotein subunit alpha/FixB family protein n=1 Tax=Niallia sp. 03091 TaxID=3458059 RepID=UPI0040440875